jgi:hypothetical protein
MIRQTTLARLDRAQEQEEIANRLSWLEKRNQKGLGARERRGPIFTHVFAGAWGGKRDPPLTEHLCLFVKTSDYFPSLKEDGR